MEDDIAISVQGVSKAYRMWETPGARLTSPLFAKSASILPAKSSLARLLHAKAHCKYRDFWALNDINFDIKKGESIGIIGRNGSGKSTLLQIIAGTLQPTTGTVKVNGRVAALLELGSGFNPEFTGRENVYLNAALLGLSESVTDSLFDAIATFADIGDFLDQPVKTYSSGMLVRLAFSVATNIDPEILIVDEALGVGDVFFQQKCFARVREMQARGASILFVSHDTCAVQNICSKALFLDAGHEAFYGDTKEAVTRYFASAAPKNKDAPKPSPSQSALDLNFNAHMDWIKKHNILNQARNRHGSRAMEILAAAIHDDDNPRSHRVHVGNRLKFSNLVLSNREIAEPQIGLNLYDRFNTLVFASGNHNVGYTLGPLKKDSLLIVEFSLTFDIQPGDYTISLIVSEESQDGPNAGMFYDVHEGLGPINVYFPSDKLMPFYGIAKLPIQYLSNHTIQLELAQ